MTLPRSNSPIDPDLCFEKSFMEGGTIKIHERELPNATARFAMDLLHTNGILMGDSDGEDSSGRAKLKAMPPATLVERALNVAEEFFAQTRARGHMLLLPDREEATTKADEAEERAEQRKAERRAAKQAARATENA